MEILTPQDDPYSERITTFLARQFPHANNGNKGTLLEILTAILYATKETRYGPMPKPEALVTVRDIIRRKIEQGEPLPILSPWGSVKYLQANEGTDIAELSALHTLHTLDKAIREHYDPGTEIRLRIEDASGFYLFDDQPRAEVEKATARYSGDMVKLVDVLGYRQAIAPILESTLFTESDFSKQADAILDKMLAYIVNSDRYGIPESFTAALATPQFRALADLGWNGTLPKEQRDYYRARYASLYPGISAEAIDLKMARYFSAALARVKLHGTGTRPAWGKDRINVTFVPPVPGTPGTERDIYYRGIPASHTRTHLPPWRAKGYLEISAADEITYKATPWRDQPSDLTRMTTTLCNTERTVTVEIGTDYRTV